MIYLSKKTVKKKIYIYIYIYVYIYIYIYMQKKYIYNICKTIFWNI